MRLILAVLISAVIVSAVLVTLSFGGHGRFTSKPVQLEHGVGGCGGCL